MVEIGSDDTGSGWVGRDSSTDFSRIEEIIMSDKPYTEVEKFKEVAKEKEIQKEKDKEHGKPEKDVKDQKEHKDNKDHKEQKEQKDGKDNKDHKDQKDKDKDKDGKDNKDQKDHKDGKNETKEKQEKEKHEKEIKDHKDHKEVAKEKEPKEKELKDHKELEQVKQKEEELTNKYFAEYTTVAPVDPAMAQRLAALEATVAQLLHFIPSALRPDLAAGALAQEEDVKKTALPGGSGSETGEKGKASPEKDKKK